MQQFFKTLKKDKQLQQRVTLALIILLCVISLALNLLQKHTIQACMNADEAAHGYNAFSLLKTGRDEYGKLLPLRFKSFGEYKMPLYTYSIVPFVAVMGLTLDAVRTPNVLMSMLFPLAVYFLTVNVFHKRSIGLLAAIITTGSLGLHIIGRQGHEVYMSTVFMVVATAAFIRTLNKKAWIWTVLCAATLALAMLGYQAARIYTAVMLAILWAQTLRRAFPWQQALALTTTVALMLIPDVLLPPQRVGSLWYFASEGLHLKVLEYRMEGGSGLIFNKATVAAYDILMRHITYYTPQFLVEHGDPNYRFGYPDMSPINPLIYLFAIIGVYTMIRTKRNRDYVLFFIFLAIAPLAGSLTWADVSITRAFFLLPLIHVVAAAGVYSTSLWIAKNPRRLIPVGAALVLIYGYFQIKTWDIFLHHYSHRTEVAKAQQCGYDQIGAYIQNHSDVRQFYITRENGQPYIYVLFYTQYDPHTYQQKNHLSAPDEYGFGQVETFDRYSFTLPYRFPPGSVIIGTPDDVHNQEGMQGVNPKKLTWIRTGKYEAFFIYRVPNK